jgi:hypothetical protein
MHCLQSPCQLVWQEKPSPERFSYLLEKSRRGAFFKPSVSLPPAKGVAFAGCLVPPYWKKVAEALFSNEPMLSGAHSRVASRHTRGS